MPVLKSVSLKLVRIVLLTVAVTLALGITFFFYVERREYTDTLRNEAFQDSSIIMTSLEHAMMDNLNSHGAGRDTHHTQDIMKTLAGTNLVHSLLITDPTGRIDIASEPSLQGTFFSTGGAICARCHTQAPRPGQLVDSYRQANGEDLLRSVIPIFNRPGCNACHRERVLGLMVNDLHTENMQSHARLQSRRFVFLALAIFSVITFSLVLQVNRIIRKPVQALVRAHQALAGGDYKASVSLKSDDEIGYLAESFNQMAERIKDSHTALERWNVALEEQVARRTAELNAANQLLSREKRHSESMARSIVEGVLSVDPDGKIDMLNSPVTKILGRSDVQATGMPLEEVVRAAASQFNRPGEFEDIILEKGKNTDGYLGIIEQIQPERRTFKVSGNRIGGPEEEDSGRVFTFHDITREREIDEIKTNLLAMVSHELRTPLTSIKGAITLLAEGRVNEIEKKEFLTIALANTERLVDLINNLLDLGKIESGRIFYDHGTFFIRRLLEECLQEVSAVASRHGVNVVLDVPETIADATGDASKIEQVVVNLISNAMKFSPGGSEIRVSVEQGPGEYTFTVLDRGIGIPDGEKSRIFDKFYQVDMSSVRSAGGSGLGLTISKAIVEAHGGRIWVEDTPGGGSTFRFTLPREPAAQVAHRKSAVPEVVSGHRIAQRVLVVEDEEAVRKILTRYLQERGIEVLQAATAQEALRLARTGHPDCITMDIKLPDIDGLDVTTILKSDPSTRDIPVIFLTVMEGEARARGLAMGAAAFYKKPAHYDQVVEKIISLVGPATPGTKGKAILLVDDDPDILRYLEADLSHHEYRVTCARSGEEAKTCLEKSVPDLLILDLRLPGITGYDILKLVRSDPRYALMAVIVISASEGDQSRLRVMQMGAASFLRKPVSPEVLHREIGKVIH